LLEGSGRFRLVEWRAAFSALTTRHDSSAVKATFDFG
jgi:hypothetical protein